MTNKRCNKCRAVKPRDEFFKKGANGLAPFCKPCHIAYQGTRARNGKERMIEYKGGHCIRCNYNRCYNALDFHHRNPDEKDFKPSSMKNRKWDLVVIELDKCDLLCANCHREVHYELTQRQRSLSKLTNDGSGKKCTKCLILQPLCEYYNFTGSPDGLSWECKSCNYQRKTDHAFTIKSICTQYKGGKCCKCGYNKSLSALDFHHVNQVDKLFRIARIQTTKLTAKHYEELDKCQLLCANCHREEHYVISEGVEPTTFSLGRSGSSN